MIWWEHAKDYAHLFMCHSLLPFRGIAPLIAVELPFLRLQYPLSFNFIATEFAKVPVIRQSPPFLVGARLHRNIGLAQHKRLVVK